MITVNVAAVVVTANALRNAAANVRGLSRVELAGIVTDHAAALADAIVHSPECADHGEYDGDACPACAVIAAELPAGAERPHERVVRRTREGC